MSWTEQTTRQEFTANNGQTVFTVTNFGINAATDVSVFQRGSADTANDTNDILTYATDYSVTSVTSTGFTLTLTTGATVGDLVTVVRNESVASSANYAANTTIPSATLTDNFDKLTRLIQGHGTTIDKYIPKYNTSDRVTEGDLKFPKLGKFQIWRMNSAGNAIEAVTLSASPTTDSLPPDYYAGFRLFQAADADHDVTISAGYAKKRIVDVEFNLSANFTKRIDATWSEGDNNGGLAEGVSLSNNTWYHYFLIMKTDGSLDAGFDTSVTASNLLTDASDYSYYLRVGSVLTDGSANIVPFYQYKDRFFWKERRLDVSGSNPGTSAVTSRLSVPPGVNVEAQINITVARGDASQPVVYIVSSEIETFNAPDATYYDLLASASTDVVSLAKNVITDTNGNVKWQVSHSGSTTYTKIITYGWIEFFNYVD